MIILHSHLQSQLKKVVAKSGARVNFEQQMVERTITSEV